MRGAMILFLYGQDTYRSKEKLDSIKERYIDASLGDTNLAVTDCTDEDIDFPRISRMILTMPFLASKRLVVIKNLLAQGSKKLQEEIEKFLPKVPKTILLVFYEEGLPDRRSSLFKKLNRPKQAQEFRLLDNDQLRQWIKKEIESRGGEIHPLAIGKLILHVGNDLWRMSNEISKLISYRETEKQRNKETITVQDVELLVKAKIDSNIFALIDALGHKNSRQATRELHKLLDSGKNELYILTMIVYQFRNLLIVKDLSERKKSFWQIKNESGLHPFVLQKAFSQAEKFTLEELKNFYQRLLDFDIKIKSGKIEPKLALDMIVIELCKPPQR